MIGELEGIWKEKSLPLATGLGYASEPKTEQISCLEMSLNFYQIIRRHIPQESMNRKGRRRKRPWPMFKDCAGICLEGTPPIQV
jgi:hypothetical protein